MRHVWLITATSATAAGFAFSAAAQRPAAVFHASRLVARTDSFEVVIGGQARGILASALSREGDNYRLVTDMLIAPMGMRERQDMVFTASALFPVSHTSEQRGPTRSRTTTVTVADGRARGSVVSVPAGAPAATIDVAVPAGTVEDEALGVLIPTLDLAEGFAGVFNSLYVSPGAVRSQRVKVTGKENVTVPAGTFETYKVELHLDSAQVVLLYVTTATPRRLVLVRSANGDSEMRLK